MRIMVKNGKAVYSPDTESLPLSGVHLSHCAHMAGYNTPSDLLSA